MTKFDPIDWPGQLSWIPERLTPTTHQEFTVTEVQQGPPRRRADSLPMKALKGVVSLDDKSLSEIRALSRGPINLFKMADGSGKLLSFITVPFVEKSSHTIVDGITKPSEHRVRIELFDRTTP